jgi:hypothetical protein
MLSLSSCNIGGLGHVSRAVMYVAHVWNELYSILGLYSELVRHLDVPGQSDLQ